MKIIITLIFVFSMFSTYSYARECGLIGTVDERISDCATKKMANGTQWTLVTVTKSGNSVWRDDDSGKIWSDRLNRIYTQYTAAEACVSTKSLDARGNLISLAWTLPSNDDFMTAESHGIRNALPHMRYFFWSTSIYPINGRLWAGLFCGGNGSLGYEYRYLYDSVRCVAVVR